MAKAFLASNVDGNILVQGLISEGEMLTFGAGGKYLGASVISFDSRMTTKEIDVVSILNVDNELELGYIIQNEFKKAVLNIDIQTVIQGMNRIDNMVFIGRRVDNEENIAYNQYIYGFKKGTLSENYLLGVLKVEREFR